MRVLGEATWLELKLFVRDPLTVIFTMALPGLVLFVLGGVFGDTPDPEGAVFRGVGAMTYYVPAYVGLVIASMGLIGLPTHLAAYRQQGVLRRWRASSMPVGAVLGSQVIITFILAVAGSVLLLALAGIVYDLRTPDDLLGVIVAFVMSTLGFAAFGVLLGAVLPTPAAAQGAGILLWFLMMMISGAGPPPEVLTDAMRRVTDFTPLRHVIIAIQDPWLGFGWNGFELAVIAGIMLISALLAIRFFRWQ